MINTNNSILESAIKSTKEFYRTLFFAVAMLLTSAYVLVRIDFLEFSLIPVLFAITLLCIPLKSEWYQRKLKAAIYALNPFIGWRLSFDPDITGNGYPALSFLIAPGTLFTLSGFMVSFVGGDWFIFEFGTVFHRFFMISFLSWFIPSLYVGWDSENIIKTAK
ncbi:MAG: hypothetical protein COB67_02645 [SAR324 cluster bacterium]|uniref:Uncharacterized protein n=1 Tax=SAR324 cluster bacterium TaxID=2024889 RepID=A0A2A4TA07_9DELT|nr:MAG: hypothetical protein COB67_02645 [SAR324 cluster bacterium]